MFICRETSDEERIVNLFKTDCECLEYFKVRCRQKEIHVSAVEIKERGISKVSDTPVLCIYVEYPADYNNYGPRNGGVYENIAEQLRSLWLETCLRFNLELEKYYTEVWLCMGLLHNEFYSYFVDRNKEDLRKEISKVALCEPKYVFASSGGYMAIVFNENDLQPFDSWKKMISNHIVEYIERKRVELVGNVKMLPIKVLIYHMGMENLNLYGLARED